MWAVREKSTGNFIRAVPTRQRGGGTGLEPMPISIAPPRLFRRHQDASAFLKWWGKGEWFRKGSVDIYGNDQDGMEFTPRPDRNVNDMEIVEVKLVVKRT